MIFLRPLILGPTIAHTDWRAKLSVTGTVLGIPSLAVLQSWVPARRLADTRVVAEIVS
jgi:hypothetical protein